jgi:DNA mismatch endonuclease (patch repair protein)
MPKTNKKFWKSKLERNAARDQGNYALLAKQGWRVLVLWECELVHSDVLEKLKKWFPIARKRIRSGTGCRAP